MTEQRTGRGGCTLAMGFLLVGVGTLLIVSNILGFSLFWFWQQIFSWFSVYWPVLLIIWGIYKLYQRVVHPDSARVGAGEVLLLLSIVLAGLTIHFTQTLVTGLPAHISLDDIIESIDSEVSFGPAHSFYEEHRFELPSDVGLLIDNDRGSVSVQGWDESDLKVQVTKRVYRHSEEKAAEIAEEMRAQFDTPVEGPARFALDTPSDASQTQTDLEVWIPRKTPLTLSNRRGPLRVSGIEAAVGLATANDSIEVKDIQGNLKVSGRRGPVRIERVQGDVEARNLYGSLIIKEIRGNLIGETRNDSLLVENVSGTARLVNRQSRIHAHDIGSDLTIEATQTEVSAENLGATVFVETSYRPVFVKGVDGRLTIEAHSSEIEVRDIKGNLDVATTHRSVTAVGIDGGASIISRQGAVRLEGVKGAIQIEGSYHPIYINDFRSSLKVQAEHAPLTISTAELGGELQITTTYGNVQLSLPPESSFRLEATAKGGEVIASDFRQPNWEESQADDVNKLLGTVSGGASPIVIETSYGDIRILESGKQ